jgi:hypothetical protein
MKWLLKVLAVLVLSVPVGVVGTFMLGPLWTWVEERHGIEAVGHAMYAGWCFGATCSAVAVLGLALFARPARTPAR